VGGAAGAGGNDAGTPGQGGSSTGGSQVEDGGVAGRGGAGVSRIGTKSAHTGAHFLVSVEHEGGGWFPTLGWVGDALLLASSHFAGEDIG